jgi:hypothetical protein
MKPKLLLGLALVLSSVSVFALAFSIQLKPAAMSQHPDILIRSGLAAGCRNYCVVVLPQTEFPISALKGNLEINDGTNHLASCPVDGITLSEVSAKGWGSMEKNEYYRAMTNRFSRPLNGARAFNFQVATNLLADSTFSVGESSGGSASSRWFYLKDFSDEK